MLTTAPQLLSRSRTAGHVKDILHRQFCTQILDRADYKHRGSSHAPKSKKSGVSKRYGGDVVARSGLARFAKRGIAMSRAHGECTTSRMASGGIQRTS
jgi:hypothetical protein